LLKYLYIYISIKTCNIIFVNVALHYYPGFIKLFDKNKKNKLCEC